MLIGNYQVYSKHPGREFGGAVGLMRTDYRKSSPARARFTGMAGWEPKSGVPDGVRPPYTWVLPLKDGGLSSRNIITGTGTLSASGALGRNMLAALAGSGELSATGALIVSALADLTGSGTISAADLLAVLQAAADLTGSGSLAADVGALGWMLGDLAGSGSLSAPPYATGTLAADIQPFTELSPQALASAVWDAVAADSNATGSMGEKVNDAGSASNPWTEVIEGNYTASELLRIMAAALAGELSGAATSTITITGIDGTTHRIVATVDADGNRTAVTLDPD